MVIDSADLKYLSLWSNYIFLERCARHRDDRNTQDCYGTLTLYNSTSITLVTHSNKSFSHHEGEGPVPRAVSPLDGPALQQSRDVAAPARGQQLGEPQGLEPATRWGGGGGIILFVPGPRTTVSQDVQTRLAVQLAFAKFLSKIKGNFWYSACIMDTAPVSWIQHSLKNFPLF